MFPFIHTMHVCVFYSFILYNVIKISAEKDQLNYVLDLNFQLKPLCTVNILRLHSRSDCTIAITANNFNKSFDKNFETTESSDAIR